jgi:hypothetical protein
MASPDTSVFYKVKNKADFDRENEEFNLKRQLAQAELIQKQRGGTGGATGELVDRLMRARPDMGFDAALHTVQTGFRQGIQMDASGNIMPTPGYRDAVMGLEAAKKMGATQGEAQATGQKNLPVALDNATNALKYVQELRTHKGLPDVVGLKGYGGLKAYLPFAKEDDYFDGTQAEDFETRRKQLVGGTFLQAYETLKGGGQITEVEGKKAQDAIARMSTSQSEAEFNQALNDYETIIKLGLARAQGMASGAPFQSPLLQPNAMLAPPLAAPQSMPQGGGVIDYTEYFK